VPRILLVEDQPVNQDLFRRRLAARGFEVLVAESGERGVELATAQRPDLVLMDLGLAGIDGWEATRRLKADPATAGIPVIALSAHATAEARQRAAAAGCAGFETKPVQWDALLAKIEAALAARPVPPAADEADVDLAGAAAAAEEPAGPKTFSLRGPGLSGSTPPPAARAPEPPAARAAGPRVLVAEDNDPNRELLCRRLAALGYTTAEARTGREALVLARSDRFDLVLLDIVLPEVDGYQVLRELKADAVLASLPVIVLSAVDEAAAATRCVETGAEDFLTKPCDPSILRARIAAVLDRRRMRDRERADARAVADLTRAAELVARGEYDPMVLAAVTGRNDALGELGRAFDRMAREVREQLRRLREEADRRPGKAGAP
jgi:CheY-like chemotaxis protein